MRAAPPVVSHVAQWWQTGTQHALKSFIDALAQRAGACFGVELPDGHVLQAGSGAPAFQVVFHSETAMLSTLTRGHMGLLESYFDQQIDVRGNLNAAFAAAMAAGFDLQYRPWNSLENGLHEWQHSNATTEQAKANARAHYGLPGAFYRYWLDNPLMMYTCGYWPRGTRTLEQAQRQKIDHVCRKLRLAAGERYVDVGCGFGGFMFRALETTGALGTGINTATEQVDWLRAEILRRGLQDSLAVREADLRDADGPYDKLVSIGVLEHAGRDQLAQVIRAHADLLKPGGLGMIHFIGHVGHYDTELFIRKHVFPGGWIPSLADTLVQMERCGLEVLDVENLRRHYALTLDCWAERFERQWDRG